MTTFRDYVSTLPVKYTDKQERDWYDMDITSLPAIAMAAYEEYKQASRLAGKLRDKFDAIACDAVGDKAIQWGHNYGKLSFTMLDTAPKARVAAKGSVSLQDWLASNQANGGRI